MTVLHRHARRAAAALALTALVVPLTAPAGAQALVRGPAHHATVGPILFGLHDHSEADRLRTERHLGKRSALVGLFLDWQHGFPQQSYINRITTARGSVPVIATGPTGYAPLSRVIAGGEDAKAAEWAEKVKAFGRPVMIRLMAEMNGPWEPWSTGHNGNQPGEYVVAWRRIVDIFRAHGVTNVRWIWNPYRPFGKAIPMRGLYPGGDYVDWIGVDAYNFNKNNKHGWTWFEEMLRPSVRQMRAVAGSSKPFMVNEAGVTEDPRKPAWIKRMYASLPRYGVKAAVYFDMNRKRDWRLTNNPANRAASRYAVHHNGIRGAGELPLSVIERIVMTGQ